MKPVLQKTIKRHIESHGYKCAIHGGVMIIFMPFAYRVNGETKRGHQVERVTSLKDAYIKMGY